MHCAKSTSGRFLSSLTPDLYHSTHSGGLRGPPSGSSGVHRAKSAGVDGFLSFFCGARNAVDLHSQSVACYLFPSGQHFSQRLITSVMIANQSPAGSEPSQSKAGGSKQGPLPGLLRAMTQQQVQQQHERMQVRALDTYCVRA